MTLAQIQALKLMAIRGKHIYVLLVIMSTVTVVFCSLLLSQLVLNDEVYEVVDMSQKEEVAGQVNPVYTNITSDDKGVYDPVYAEKNSAHNLLESEEELVSEVSNPLSVMTPTTMVFNKKNYQLWKDTTKDNLGDRNAMYPSNSESLSHIAERETLVHHNSEPASRETVRKGYVTALQYWDQQTYSIQNILSLQAWGGWLGVNILEPFLMETKFTLPLEQKEAFHKNGTVSYLALSDIYDLDQWNKDSLKYNHKMSRLSKWKDFLETAARNVIFVHVVITPDISKIKETLTKLGFNIVQEHFIDSVSSKELTERTLTAKVYRKRVLPSEVTLIFSCWNRQNFPRVLGFMHFNMLASSFTVSLKPSTQLESDAERYSIKYLPQNKPYISILLRAEWIILYKESDITQTVLHDCLAKAIGWLNNMSNETGVTDFFVGMDIGKYGSKTLPEFDKLYMNSMGENFLRVVFSHNELTLENWENTFTEISSSDVPGYIGLLQKTIAIRGHCLLLVGYGSFHSHALQAFKKLHRSDEQCFLKTDMDCNIQTVSGFEPDSPSNNCNK